jgi:hypothetical protein
LEKHLTACNAIAGELDPSEGEAVRGDNPGKESGTVVVHSILPPALAEQVKAAADQERRQSRR